MVNLIKTLLSDKDEISSKRLIGLLSFIFLIAAGIVNLFGGTVLSSDLIFTFAGMVGTAIFGAVIEKISKNKIDQDNENEITEK